MDLNRFVKDAAMKMRSDNNQGVFIEQMLTHTIAELFRFKYPKTPFANGELCFMDQTGDPGSDRVGWQMIGEQGEFREVADNADDLPRIDINGTYDSNKARTVGAFIEYSEQDLRAASMQKVFDIATEKGQAARRGWDRTMDRFIRSVNDIGDLPGLTQRPGRSDIAATAAWSTLTPSQIADEFVATYDAIFDGTDGTIEPDTVVLPVSVRSIFKKQNSIASNVSIESFLKETYPEITAWVYNAGMNTAGRDGSKCMLMYNRDKGCVRSLVPLFMQPKAPQAQGLSWRIYFDSRYAGLAVNYPASIVTLYGI